MFERVVGQESSKRILTAAVENDGISHAYLFHGPKGVGKTTMAVELAMVLNCEERNGCGVCSSCRRIKEGIFPDVKMVAPDGPSIKIGEIRELQNFIAMSSFEGRFKVGIIQDAEKLREEAANSLLKTLEEPPEDSVIILTAQNQYAVLPTIISRVQMIRFGHLEPGEIARYLVDHKSLSADQADRLAQYCGGSLGKALELYESEETKALVEAATRVVEELTKLKPHEMIEVANTVGSERRQAVRFLELLSDILREKSLKQEFGLLFGKQYSITQIAAVLDHIEELKLYLNGYGNPQLAIEGLFIRICRM